MNIHLAKDLYMKYIKTIQLEILLNAIKMYKRLRCSTKKDM